MAAVSLCCLSCIYSDPTLGQDFIATNRQYEIKTDVFDLEDIRMEAPEGISGYSLYRFIFGAIKDDFFGTTTRSTAFTLVPVDDSLDFGLPGTLEVRQFHFSGVPDTTSCVYDNQKHILQNVHVYSLSEPMDYTKPAPELSIDRSNRISEGIPVYNGVDSLSFNFTREFTRGFIDKYLALAEKKAASNDTITIDDWRKTFPGIYIETDEPMDEGGRINMFKLPVDVYSSTIYGSYAELKFSAEYKD